MLFKIHNHTDIQYHILLSMQTLTVPSLQGYSHKETGMLITLLS